MLCSSRLPPSCRNSSNASWRIRTQPLPLEGRFPAAGQKALGERLMGALGFDFAKGRLDASLHPFCGGVPEDLRMTTRYARRTPRLA